MAGIEAQLDPVLSNFKDFCARHAKAGGYCFSVAYTNRFRGQILALQGGYFIPVNDLTVVDDDHIATQSFDIAGIM
jgi:hypothetical protein